MAGPTADGALPDQASTTRRRRRSSSQATAVQALGRFRRCDVGFLIIKAGRGQAIVEFNNLKLCVFV
jgi:hypothetical protein